jgi:two-component system nitrogen regulation response regulator GlnG
MVDVFRAIGRLSQSMVTVMITGESGSAEAGGPCTAQAFTAHQRPFVAITAAIQGPAGK